MLALLAELRPRRRTRWRTIAGVAALLATAWVSAATTVWMLGPREPATPADPGICRNEPRPWAPADSVSLHP